MGNRPIPRNPSQRTTRTPPATSNPSALICAGRSASSTRSSTAPIPGIVPITRASLGRKETAPMSNALRGLVGLIVIGAAVSALAGKISLHALTGIASPSAAHAAPGWSDIQAPVGKVLDLQSRMPGLPATAWFAQSQKSVSGDIDGLLDEAVGILGVSGADNDRQRLRDLQARAKDLQERIASWRIERTGLPEVGGLLVRSKSDCEQDIAGAAGEIARLHEQMALLRQSVEQRLPPNGIARGP